MIPIELIDADLSNVNEEKVQEFKDSITRIGLLHPITLRTKKDRYELIAGRVRLKAFIELGRTEIPATIEDSNLLPLEISIQENLRRSNLPWWEQVELELKLHELRQEQFGVKRTGRDASKSAGWSQIDTAKELGIALGAMSQDIFLANAVRRNPHLLKVQDKVTALKLAKEAAKREQIEAETLIPSSFEMNQVFNGDSLEILKEIPSETFNVCITDPPWREYKEKELTRDDSTLGVFKEVYRVLKRDSLLYVMIPWTEMADYFDFLREIGFQVQECPLIWYKKGALNHGRRNWEYLRDHEIIIVAAKGGPVLYVGTALHSVIEIPPVHSTKLVHPNEKPIELLKTLITHSTFNESCILDPFAGSGSTLLAAKELNRKYIGIERNRKFYDKIVKRLEK